MTKKIWIVVYNINEGYPVKCFLSKQKAEEYCIKMNKNPKMTLGYFIDPIPCDDTLGELPPNEN